MDMNLVSEFLRQLIQDYHFQVDIAQKMLLYYAGKNKLHHRVCFYPCEQYYNLLSRIFFQEGVHQINYSITIYQIQFWFINSQNIQGLISQKDF